MIGPWRGALITTTLQREDDRVKDNFDREFMNDDEIEEELDALLETMGDDINVLAPPMSVLSPIRLQQMQFVYAVLKYLTRTTDAKISYELQKPFKTMGSITVEGRVLEFSKAEWFSRAAEFANFTNIYPLSANRVRLEFTFHGLTIPVAGGEEQK